MEHQHHAMEEGETGDALKARDHLGAGIEPILPRAPGLQRSARNVEPVGGLTLGEPLSLQVAILFKEFSASASLPSLGTITMATWLRIKDSTHRILLTQPWLCVNAMAKDGEGTPLLQPFLRRRLYEVADAVIKAGSLMSKSLHQGACDEL
jgi:hypothetical protein